jgi:Raf kinase inhibitor-like YbhB/YbcL family protein
MKKLAVLLGLFLSFMLMFSSGYAMKLSSAAFTDNGFIPIKYSCKGEDISPPLQWTETPPETQSFVLILSDPDAPMGAWDHWIVVNIPSTQTVLAEDVKSLETLPNSWGSTIYKGPCPPSGTHHYVFDLYALNIRQLNLPKNTDKNSLLIALKPHILDSAQLVGLFQK